MIERDTIGGTCVNVGCIPSKALRDDYDLFCQVDVDPEAGTITWPNGADISPRTLDAESKPKVPA